VEQATLDHGYYRRLYGGAVPTVPRFFDASQLVLEIGCGGGWNLLPYKQKGLSHVGFDYDANMIDFGRANYGLNIFRGGLQEAVAQGVRANYVILSHVLEHVSDPVGFLITLRDVMAPGAVLRITVPCLDYLRFFGGSGTGYEFAFNLQNAHNYFFSERTLSMTVRKAGYSVIVGVGGFCLAQKSSFPGASVADKDTDAWREVLQLIASSEKTGSRKKWLLGRIPSGLKRALPYVHLLSRPLGVAKYVLVHKTGFGKYALLWKGDAT
jgi:SAM-dependent methyltransferase